MKKYFIVSLCREGILGGGIVVDSDKIVYRTNKVTVSKQFRNLEMKYSEIKEISTGWLLCFPTVSLRMMDNEEYKFIIFQRKKFINLLSEKVNH